MSNYAKLYNHVGTPQSQPVPASVSTAEQVKNNAGGVVFQLDKFSRLERFLILGSDSNTYYQKAPKLTQENAACVTECWTEDPFKTAQIINTISFEGRAPKNSPAIFALALGAIHPNKTARQFAFAGVHHVCRTSTHLFEFVSTCEQLKKGWGRGMKRAVADWYNNKTDEQLAYQLVKYRQREGYTHERLIRLSHPTTAIVSAERRAMYDWLRGRKVNHSDLPSQIHSHMLSMECHPDEVNFILKAIREDHLPWEALPTWANTKPEVWMALLPKMPLTAMMRNLGNITRLGIFNSSFTGKASEAVCRLCSEEELKRARLHPFNILNALSTYQSGSGFRGQNNWMPNQGVCEVLEAAFYRSFKLITPSNKRIMLALDVSSSMSGAKLMNSNLSAREASAAMAMATMKSEERCLVTGFTCLHGHNTGMDISPLNINPGMSLDQIVRYTHGLPFSRTDCSLPILYALEERIAIDAFVIYTDNETWAGRIAPVEALNKYREQSGIDAKLIVVGMTSTGFSIADPNDPGMLDVVGFDANAPAIISSFIHDKHALLQDHTSETSRVEEEN